MVAPAREARTPVAIDPERAMYRTKYRNLLRQRADLEQQIAARGVWASLLRGQNEQNLLRLNRALDKFRTDHPEVADVTLDDLAHPLYREEEATYLRNATSPRSTPEVRGTAAGKIFASGKADAVQLFDFDTRRSTPISTRRRYEERRRQPLEISMPRESVMRTLHQILNNPPGLFSSQASWFDQFHEPERELVAYTLRGETSLAVQYWDRKLAVLNEIRPSLFGRERWQQEHNSAVTHKREAETERSRRATTRAQTERPPALAA
jgi:hypothetical protein